MLPLGIKMFFANFKSWLPGLLVILVVVGILTYIKLLKNDIKKYEGTIGSYKELVKEYEANATIAKLEIATLELNNNSLSSAIDKTNTAIENMKVNENALRAEVTKWKNQTPKEVIKYVEKIVKVKDKKNATCEDYKRVNENISKIKYKDL